MSETKTNNVDKELMINLKGQVDNQLARLTTAIPDYRELPEEEKQRVDKYIATIDLQNVQTIDELGKNETEKIAKELDLLIGTLRTRDISIEEMFTQLMMSIDENSKPEGESFIELLKKSPLTALRSLKDKPKTALASQRYRREKVLTNIEVIRERLESIRNELRMNVGKLEIIAQNSIEQYVNMQYQITALQEVLRRLQEEKEAEEQLTRKTIFQIDQSIQAVGIEKKISRKIKNCRGESINAATKAIMARLIALHNDELASNYDQDLTNLLPRIKGVVAIAEANDSLIQAVDSHNQFVNTMNEMLRAESKRSKEAIKSVQSISEGSDMDIETARILTSDVIEVVTSLKATQDAGKSTNQAFIEILDDFRSTLINELSGNEIEQKSNQEEEERGR